MATIEQQLAFEQTVMARFNQIRSTLQGANFSIMSQWGNYYDSYFIDIMVPMTVLFDYINQQINPISQLVNNNIASTYAYIDKQDVYFRSLVVNSYNALNRKIDTIEVETRGYALNLFNSILGFMDEDYNALDNKITVLTNQINNISSITQDEVSNLVADSQQSTMAALGSEVAEINNWMETVIDWTSSTFTNVIESVTTQFNNTYDWVTLKIKDASDMTWRWLRSFEADFLIALNQVSKAVNDTVSNLNTKLTGAIDVVKNFLDLFIEVLNDVLRHPIIDGLRALLLPAGEAIQTSLIDVIRQKQSEARFVEMLPIGFKVPDSLKV